VRGRSMRLLVSIGLATTLATVAGCGAVQVTTGTVPGSKDGPHLGQAEFVPVVEQAMAKAFSVHAVVDGTKGSRKSSIVADVAFRRGASMKVTMTDGLGMYGAASTQKEELRLVGDHVYVSAAHKHGKFVAIALAGPRSAYGRLADATRRSVRPDQSLEPVRRGLRSLAYEGMDAGQGLYLDHYVLVVGTAKAFGAATAKKLHAPATITFQVWLDSDHLLRRMTYELDGIKLDASYTAWGRRVDVEAPGPKDIVRTMRG
jgi:hypothetical protein